MAFKDKASEREYKNAWRKAQRAANPGDDAAYQRERRLQNLEYHRQYHREWYAKNKHKAHATMRRMLAKQEAEYVAEAGRPRPDICDICGGRGKRGIVFDHCHQTGQFRGWICDSCNIALGMARDSIDILTKMIAYLQRADGRSPQFALPGI